MNTSHTLLFNPVDVQVRVQVAPPSVLLYTPLLAPATTDLVGWNRTIEQFLADQKQLVAIINDPDVDLFAPLPNSGEYRHTILREINIIATHNSYHIGELAIMRSVMNLWPPE